MRITLCLRHQEEVCEIKTKTQPDFNTNTSKHFESYQASSSQQQGYIIGWSPTSDSAPTKNPTRPSTCLSLSLSPRWIIPAWPESRPSFPPGRSLLRCRSDPLLRRPSVRRRSRCLGAALILAAQAGANQATCVRSSTLTFKGLWQTNAATRTGRVW